MSVSLTTTAAPLSSTVEASSVFPTTSATAADTAEQKTIRRKMTKKKMKKVLKDPAAPKRPMTSFFLFGEEERPRVMAELGNISVGEVAKELGRRWAVSDKDRKGRYETIHMEAKARYEEEIKNYQPSQEFLKKKSEQASEGMAEYFSFLKENWPNVVMEHKVMEEKEAQEMVWQIVRSKEKGLKTKKRNISKPKITAETKITAKPKTPVSAILIFQKEITEKLVEMAGVTLSNAEVLGMVTERWKTLDQDLKMEYEKRVEGEV
jgi:hypothetical protein